MEMDICQESTVCGKCTNLCAEDSLACSMCRIWFHQRCVKVANEKYKYIMSSDRDLLWLCEVCRKRPWHFCICSKSGELNISNSEVNALEHNCQQIQKTNEINAILNCNIKLEELNEEIINTGMSPNHPSGNCAEETNIENETVTVKNTEAFLEETQLSVEEIFTETSNHHSAVNGENVLNDSRHCCSICNMTFRSSYALRFHSVTHIPKEGVDLGISKPIDNNERSETKEIYKCKQCGKSFKYEAVFNFHVLNHDVPKQGTFNCNQCDKTFKTYATLRKHTVFIHLNDTRHTCKICNMRFRTACYLRTHSLTHVPKEERTVYQCNVCNKEFRGPRYYRMHMKTNCFRDAPVQNVKVDTKIFECDLCEKKFKWKQALNVHKQKHTGIYRKHPCKECDKTFNSAAAAYSHVKLCHTERLACHHCGKLICGKKNLEIHIATVHLGERSYLCDICGDALKSQGALKKHRKIHTGEKPYVCDSCGKSFSSCGAMTTHKKKHGPKTQECDECHKTFTLKSTLKAHKLLHSGEKPHKCEKCGKGFMWFTSYQLHRKNHKICGTGKGSWGGSITELRS